MNNTFFTPSVENNQPSTDITFAKQKSTIIDIDERLYSNIAQNLTRQIGGKEFYSGTIHTPADGFCASLTTTLIVYHKNILLPEGSARIVEDIVPVWWEMHTTLDSGEEVNNNFSFRELKDTMLD